MRQPRIFCSVITQCSDCADGSRLGGRLRKFAPRVQAVEMYQDAVGTFRHLSDLASFARQSVARRVRTSIAHPTTMLPIISATDDPDPATPAPLKQGESHALVCGGGWQTQMIQDKNGPAMGHCTRGSASYRVHAPIRWIHDVLGDGRNVSHILDATVRLFLAPDHLLSPLPACGMTPASSRGTPPRVDVCEESGQS